MSFSYKPLWKLLIDREMSKKALMDLTKISKSTMDKMGRAEPVSMEVLNRICEKMECKIEDVIEYKSDGVQNNVE